MKVLQVTVEVRNHAELIVGQLQVHQRGQVEHGLGDAFVAQLVVVQPHKRQVSETFKVVSAQHDQRGKQTLSGVSLYGFSLGDAACFQRLCGSACTVYLLWDVIYAVFIQEQLNKASWYTGRHLL